MFIDLAAKRRSVRRFQKRQVEKGKIDLLIEAALRAPSSRGFNPWHFIVVDEPEIIGRLAEAKPHGASFLKNAPLAIVVCADPQVSDVWVEDAAIASIFIHMAATDLGLGSCWVQIRKREHVPRQDSGQYVAAILNLPENLRVDSIIAIGYAAEDKPPHSKEELQHDKVSYNKYGWKD